MKEDKEDKEDNIIVVIFIGSFALIMYMVCMYLIFNYAIR